MVKELTKIQVALVSIIITLFFLFILYSIRKLSIQYGEGPVYDRSATLVLLANISNYFEIICNIMSALYYLDESAKGSLWIGIPVTLAIFGTRFYAGIMALRVYRIIALHNYRIGESSRNSLYRSANYKGIITKVILYSFILTTPAVCFYAFLENPEFVLSLYNTILYSLEGLWFMFNNALLIRTVTHPTIIVEHLLYSVFWVSGAVSFEWELFDRWLFVIPIRNSCLLLISFISLNAHCNLLRPPLPCEPGFLDIFEIREICEDFQEFVNRTSSIEVIEACLLSREFTRAVFCEDYTIFYKALCKNEKYSQSFMSYLISGNMEYLRDSLESIIYPDMLMYLKSKEFQECRKRYFIIYN